MKTWQVILLSELIAKNIKLPEIPQEPTQEEPIVERVKGSTKFVNLYRVRISGKYNVLKRNAPGKLHEFVVVSPSDKFSVLISCDDSYSQFSYRDLKEITQYSEQISAFEDNNYYIVRFSDISWKDSFTLSISAEEPIVFNRIFASYTVFS